MLRFPWGWKVSRKLHCCDPRCPTLRSRYAIQRQKFRFKLDHTAYNIGGYESRYSSLEKACLALVWATQRLKHYMLAYQVWLLSRMDPLKSLFEKPALSGRTARWQLLLSEFDITYVTQKSMNGIKKKKKKKFYRKFWIIYKSYRYLIYLQDHCI